MRAILRFLKSTRLAVVLILVITVLSILATLIPQGRELSFYSQQYPGFLYTLITAFEAWHFFSSPLFIAALSLFALNLGVCAVDRFVTRLRTKAPTRYGPDLVHLGLLVLIAGGIVTGLLRNEKLYTLSEGDSAEVAPGYTMSLLSFEYQKYPNGTPKAWISNVEVTHDGVVAVPSFAIKVNKPLRIGGYQIYQTTYELSGVLHAVDPDGKTVAAATGDGFEYGDSFFLFAETEKAPDGGWRAVFQEYKGMTLDATHSIGPNEKIGPYTITQVSGAYISGLKAVKDPGYLPVIIAFLIIVSGLALTFIQRAREGMKSAP